MSTGIRSTRRAHEAPRTVAPSSATGQPGPATSTAPMATSMMAPRRRCPATDPDDDPSTDQADRDQCRREKGRQQGDLAPADAELVLERRQDGSDARQQIREAGTDAEQEPARFPRGASVSNPGCIRLS